MTSPSAAARPVLITGANRSGTTWVGDMLCRGDGIVYMHEPFNPQVRPQWFTGLPFERTQYIDDSNADLYKQRLEGLVSARPPWRHLLSDMGSASSVRGAKTLNDISRSVRKGARLVLKDPLAVFASKHLSSAYEVDVVVCVRQPTAYAGSLKRMGWAFDFGNWTRQSQFLEGPAQPWAEEIERAANSSIDLVDTAILRWKVTYSILDRWRREDPRWTVVDHSTLAKDPERGFEDLYATLKIPFVDGVRHEIVKVNAPGNTFLVADHDKGGTERDSAATIDTWKSRLTPAEVERVLEATAGVAHAYADIGSDDW
ncbi:MAG: sulfotransferase [Actinomycetia bacterium]|nr:sulfotransferase [Actinomycetes bacterium]MCP4960677.1 sulfotransferase [Actinomycetes bacterium]